ncbi:DNA topoisomerase IB [Segetibacter koreensis]|uniref:DNA topoisomerase IB n=1 Tax=Segetibacter koreensis TaxID=398037 RepID=UPI00035D6780|nr:DNA topoisomerase IB [Segetibacter koreensis]
MDSTIAADAIASIPKRRIRSILKSPVKTAEAVNLVYLSDNVPGIERIKTNDGFEYKYQGKKVTDEETLLRIKRLVLPPAWENVWISPKDNGHLQATGIDTKNRKQYKYHASWNALRNRTKFYRLYQFGTVLPSLRLKVEKDLSLPGLPVEKVLATVVSLMERTNIRIGNCSYEKANGSYGITTLKDRHVKIQGTSIKFSFKGKKGVYHDIDIKSKRLAKIVKKCQDIPGKELFQFIDDDGHRRSIDSGMVNDYIKSIGDGDFTAKDLRTWSGTVQALLAFKELGLSDTQSETKKNIVAALDMVAGALGNTRTVCKKYYVHPLIVSLYETKTLEKHLKHLDSLEDDDNKADLTKEEKILMEILKSN